VTVRGGTGDTGASVAALPWWVHAASAIGAGHVRDGKPNQDAVAYELTQAPEGAALLAVAVADGHGDSRHFRSDRGARMAVAAGIAAMQEWSAGLSGGPAEIRLSARRDLVPGIVARWNAAMQADLSGDHFSAAEQALLAGLGLPPPTAYGSTLLLGAFTGGYAVFAQIGDGNIVGVLPDGGAMSPVPDDSALDGIHTTSLCQPDADAAFRIGVIQLAERPVFAVLLGTDGFGNAQAEDPWQPSLAADLASFGLDHDESWFANQVPGWAAQCASSAGSGDDATIALVVNSAVRPGRGRSGAASGSESPTVTAPMRPAGVPVSTGPGGPGDHRRQDPSRDRGRREPGGGRRGWPLNRAGAWTAAAVVVVLVGLVLAFALSGHGRGLPRHTGQLSPTPSGKASASPTPSAGARTSPTPSASPTARPTPSASAGTSAPAGITLPRVGLSASTLASARNRSAVRGGAEPPPVSLAQRNR
jgi:hypothetical protein